MKALKADTPVIVIRKRSRPDLLGTTAVTVAHKGDNDPGEAVAQADGEGQKPPVSGLSVSCPDDDGGNGYEVGYGKPPQASRFSAENQPKGRGRKRKPTSVREAELALMNAKYPHVEKGKQGFINGFELMARVRFNKAGKGDMRAMKEILLNVMPTTEELDEIAQGRPLTEHEANIWKMMVDIARGEGGDN
jgi:hypothetical protein